MAQAQSTLRNYVSPQTTVDKISAEVYFTALGQLGLTQAQAEFLALSAELASHECCRHAHRGSPLLCDMLDGSIAQVKARMEELEAFLKTRQ